MLPLAETVNSFVVTTENDGMYCTKRLFPLFPVGGGGERRGRRGRKEGEEEEGR